MADLFNIMKIHVSADKLRARVLVNPGMPVRTSEDIEATARVYYLAPAIAQHACYGDAGEKFQDCMGDTEIAHLLEHLTVEIMNETGLAGAISCGRTKGVAEDPRLFDIELSCPDDALTVGALSSAAFMMQWAFVHPDTPAPDFAGTVGALTQLVRNLRGEADVPAAAEEASDAAPADDDGAVVDTEAATEQAAGNEASDAVFGGAAAASHSA